MFELVTKEALRRVSSWMKKMAWNLRIIRVFNTEGKICRLNYAKTGITIGTNYLTFQNAIWSRDLGQSHGEK